MSAKNHLLIFSSFLDIWENVEWPRFFGPPGILSQILLKLHGTSSPVIVLHGTKKSIVQIFYSPHGSKTSNAKIEKHAIYIGLP